MVEINKRFHVEEVDLNIKENTKEHHTNKYMCTKRKVNPSLVIRRGQPFTMTIKCDRDYNEEQNEISFYFKTGTYIQLQLLFLHLSEKGCNIFIQ